MGGAYTKIRGVERERNAIPTLMRSSSQAGGLEKRDSQFDLDIQRKSLNEENIKSQRAKLHQAIAQNTDYTQIIQDLIGLPGFDLKKYKTVDVAALIRENDLGKSGLEHMFSALNTFEKYCRHLMKPIEKRSKQWNVIKFQNTIFMEKLSAINGAQAILWQIGYTVDIDAGLAFPVGGAPSEHNLINLIGDFLLAKMEIDAYIKGTHPYAHHINEMWFKDGDDNDQLFGDQAIPAIMHKVVYATIEPVGATCDEASDSQARGIQESNSTPALPVREPSPYQMEPCDVCGADGILVCTACDNKRLCHKCDAKWHIHPRRQSHQRFEAHALPNFTPDGIHLSQIRTMDSGNLPNHWSSHSHNLSDSPYSTNKSNVNNSNSSPYSTNKSNVNNSNTSPYSTNKSPYSTNKSPYSTNESPYSTNRSLNESRDEAGEGAFKFFEELQQSTLKKEALLHTSNLSLNVDTSASNSAGLVFSSGDGHRSNMCDQISNISSQLEDCENKLRSVRLEDKNYDMNRVYYELTTEQSILKNDRATLVRRLSELDAPWDESEWLPRSESLTGDSRQSSVGRRSNRTAIVDNLEILTEELSGHDKKLNVLMLSEPDFFASREFQSLSRSKAKLMRDKSKLEKSLAVVDGETSGGAESARKLISNENRPIRQERPPRASGDADFTIPGASVMQYDYRATNPVCPPLFVAPNSQDSHLNLSSDGSISRGFHGNVPSQNTSHLNDVVYPYPHRSPTTVPDQLPFRVDTQKHPAPPYNLVESIRTAQSQGRFDRNLPIDPLFRETVSPNDYNPLVKPPGDLPQPVLRPVRFSDRTDSSWVLISERRKTPEAPRAWHCRYCTMINSTTVKICSMCGRTNDDPIREGTSDDVFESGTLDDMSQIYVENLQASSESCVQRNLPIRDVKSLSVSKCQRSSSETDLMSLMQSGSETPAKGNVIGTLSVNDYSLLHSAELSQLYDDGLTLVRQLKEADSIGFKFEEWQIAVEHTRPDNLVNWLKMNFHQLINDVVSGAAEVIGNETGNITRADAREALLATGGNADEAIQLCVMSRREKIEQFSVGYFSAPEISATLTLCNGDVEQTMEHLNSARTRPFLDRMWVMNEQLMEALSSVVEDQSFANTVLDESLNFDRRARMLLAEGKLQGWGRVNSVFKLVYLTKDRRGAELPTLYDIVDAVKNNNDLNSMRSHLSHVCSICCGEFPNSQIMSLMLCECKICRECLIGHFTVVIREQSILHWTCPTCSKPDMTLENDVSDFLSFLQLHMENTFEPSVKVLFETKIRDWKLSTDPNFRWCPRCDNGFIYNGVNPMTCQNCLSVSCMDCKKPWEVQHVELTCQQFALWKADNDPENQAIRLTQHLEQHGIQCPKCKTKYDLARGGCMHFTCTQCKHEFCCGCYEAFYKPGTCNRFKRCTGHGLHSHHPRDCYFYMRDMDIFTLQQLLKKYDVPFKTKTPDDQDREGGCPVMLQKENLDQKKDEECGTAVTDGHAGLCLTHYKELLSREINHHNVDPISVMTVDEMIRVLNRSDIPIPMDTGSLEQYMQIITALVKQKVPLVKHGALNHVG